MRLQSTSPLVQLLAVQRWAVTPSSSDTTCSGSPALSWLLVSEPVKQKYGKRNSYMLALTECSEGKQQNQILSCQPTLKTQNNKANIGLNILVKVPSAAITASSHRRHDATSFTHLYLWIVYSSLQIMRTSIGLDGDHQWTVILGLSRCLTD